MMGGAGGLSLDLVHFKKRKEKRKENYLQVSSVLWRRNSGLELHNSETQRMFLLFQFFNQSGGEVDNPLEASLKPSMRPSRLLYSVVQPSHRSFSANACWVKSPAESPPSSSLSTISLSRARHRWASESATEARRSASPRANSAS